MDDTGLLTARGLQKDSPGKKKKRILTKLEAAPHALHYSLWSLTASCFTFHYSTRLELVLLKGNAGTSSDVLM